MNGIIMNDSLYQPEWYAVHDTLYLSEVSHTYTCSDMASQLDVFCGNWMFGWMFGLSLLVVIILCSKLFPCVAKFVNNILKIFNCKHRKLLSIISIGVWFIGTIIYVIGFYDTAVIVNTSKGFYNFMYGISLFMRAAISSLAMFLTRTDWGLLNVALQQSWLYGLLFILVHACALFLTVGLILRLFFYRFLVKTQLNVWSKEGGYICVLWGMNSASIALAQDIKENGENTYHCVFVLENDSQIKSGKLTFANLLGINHNSASILDQVEDLNAVAIRGLTRDVLGELSGISEENNISIFILSDDEQQNLNIANMIVKDAIYKSLKDHCAIYCHARRTPSNLLFEYDINGEANLTVETEGIKKKYFRIVDSAYLSVLSLKTDKKALPINFVNIETKSVDGKNLSIGAVSGEFTSLVLGFGEVGQEALEFLYEYSSFVKADGSPAPHKCIAIDQNMSNIASRYYKNRPALQSNPDIVLNSAITGSREYWQIIDEIVSKLNYVVVALGDDELNATVALELYQYIIRKRVVEPKNLVIYVYQKYRNDDFVINKNINDLYYDKIRFFGDEKSNFTSAKLLQKKNINIAEHFNTKYEQARNDFNNNTSPTNTNSNSNNQATLIDFRRRCRKNEQNMENVFHMMTKIYLITNGNFDCSYLRWLGEASRKRKEFKNKVEYEYLQDNIKSDFVTQLMKNVAKCEHLRWMAKQQMVGYDRNDKDKDNNELSMRMNTLVAWDEFDEIWKILKDIDPWPEFKIFNYLVVETSINVYEDGLFE